MIFKYRYGLRSDQMITISTFLTPKLFNRRVFNCDITDLYGVYINPNKLKISVRI